MVKSAARLVSYLLILCFAADPSLGQAFARSTSIPFPTSCDAFVLQAIPAPVLGVITTEATDRKASTARHVAAVVPGMEHGLGVPAMMKEQRMQWEAYYDTQIKAAGLHPLIEAAVRKILDDPVFFGLPIHIVEEEEEAEKNGREFVRVIFTRANGPQARKRGFGVQIEQNPQGEFQGYRVFYITSYTSKTWYVALGRQTSDKDKLLAMIDDFLDIVLRGHHYEKRVQWFHDLRTELSVEAPPAPGKSVGKVQVGSLAWYRQLLKDSKLPDSIAAAALRVLGHRIFKGLPLELVVHKNRKAVYLVAERRTGRFPHRRAIEIASRNNRYEIAYVSDYKESDKTAEYVRLSIPDPADFLQIIGVLLNTFESIRSIRPLMNWIDGLRDENQAMPNGWRIQSGA